MALDHYVSQVHLRKFYSPALGSKLHAIRKHDLFESTYSAKEICRIEAGNTNPYLQDPRAVEEFLKSVEPQYNNALETLEKGIPNPDTIFTIAGFVAYVSTCTPGAMRVDSGPLRDITRVTGEMLDSKGLLPKPLPVLNARNFSDLITSGKAEIEIDPKYPQSFSISGIKSRVAAFGNFKWEVIINKFADSPFFTSDSPIVLQGTKDFTVFNRLVPLSPQLAVRICPTRAIDKREFALDFKHFGWRRISPSRTEIVAINKSIVRSAETEVYFRDDLPWIRSFVKKNSRYRVEPQTMRIPQPGGSLLFFKNEVRERIDGV